MHREFELRDSRAKKWNIGRGVEEGGGGGSTGVWCAPVRWANRADEDSSEVAGLDGERQVYAGGRKKIAEKERGRRVEYTERRREREREKGGRERRGGLDGRSVRERVEKRGGTGDRTGGKNR